jgi:hypothetical protein
MRNSPLGASGADSITGALVDVYKRIAEQQRNGGELNRANILLITDAVAPVHFAQIEAARKGISADVDLRLNAISMGDLNKDVTQLVEMAGGEGKGKLGLVAHQHIDYQQVNALLQAEQQIQVLEISSQSFNAKGQESLGNQALIKLKNKVIGLETAKTAEDAALLSSYSGLKNRLLEHGANEESAAITPSLNSFKTIAFSDVSNGFTQAEKLDILWDFVAELGKELGSDGENIIDQLSEEQKRLLRRWIGI